MKSISVFLDIAKFANFWWQNAVVNKTQEVYHVVHVLFWCSLSIEQLCQVPFYMWHILGRGGGSFCPIPSSVRSPKIAHPIGLRQLKNNIKGLDPCNFVKAIKMLSRNFYHLFQLLYRNIFAGNLFGYITLWVLVLS